MIARAGSIGKMRSTWLALTLVAVGCFSEPSSSGGCVDGEAACDCRTDDTCDEGLDCVATIDKCVPTGCTPGSESCTCVDGDCLSGLVCDGGVCIPPSAATTGGDASMSDSMATVGTVTMSVTITASDPSDSTSTPDDTSATEPTGMSASMSTDPSDTSVGGTEESTGASETSSEMCPGCIDSAASSTCGNEASVCQDHGENMGCKALQGCISGLVPVDDCCAAASPIARAYWNALVTCAQMDTCTDACEPFCS
jgi:hypothetical protein